MADFDAQQPVRAIATQFTTEVANATGTTINPAEDYAQGSTTSGQNGVLTLGAVTTAAPAYTTGQSSPLSLTTVGALRIDGSATTQPVSGTITANQGTPAAAANKWPIEIVDSGGVNIASVNASNELLVTDTDLTLAQGSTTAGQVGPLIQGAVTTASPSYTTAQTSPLSLTPAGALRVDGSAVTQPVSGTVTANQGTSPWVTNETQIDGTAISVNTGNADAGTQRVVIASNQPPINVNIGGGVTPVLTYFTDTAVATNASVTHSLAGPVSLDHIHATGSGEIKLTIAIGVTGSEVTYWNGFTSASFQNVEFDLKDPYVIPTGSSAKVTILNRDKQAQDVYLTFFSH